MKKYIIISMGQSYSRTHKIQKEETSCWKRFFCFWPCCKKKRFVDAYVKEEESDPIVAQKKDLNYWFAEHRRLSRKVEELQMTPKLREEWNDPSVGQVFSSNGMSMMTLPPSWNPPVDHPLMKKLRYAEKRIDELGDSSEPIDDSY